mgnify:CR=1 FL=1
MIVEKPKPKQLQSQSQVEAIIFSNPGIDGINRAIFLFLQTNESKINTNHVSYFEKKKWLDKTQNQYHTCFH